MADHDKKEEEEDVQGHKLVLGPDSLHVAGPDTHVAANKDDEDDVEGHIHAPGSHVAKPEMKHEDS